MYSEKQRQWAKDFLAQCEKKINDVMGDINKDYPYTTIDGRYENFDNFPFSWTSGFFGGIMWLLYIQTGKEEYKARAIQCSERMKAALSEPENYNCLDNHDLGFVFSLTNVAHFKLCGDTDARIRALHAATMLAGRFNLKGQYIRAWRNGIHGNDTKGYAIIDCLMNLPLLYWAAEEYGDERFALFAKAHAETALKEFVKPDGSVYHIVNFDTNTGKVKDYPRGQGYASGSSWSRGQSWGIYGFTLSYKYTGDERFLQAAKGVADYVIENIEKYREQMPGYLIPPVDYMQPIETVMWDASAGAITASGMIELAKCLGEAEVKECKDAKQYGETYTKYADFAFSLLEGLCHDCDFSMNDQAIVQSATELYHGKRCHFPLIYADYYLIEALMKCVGEKEFLMW